MSLHMGSLPEGKGARNKTGVLGYSIGSVFHLTSQFVQGPGEAQGGPGKMPRPALIYSSDL